MSEPSAETRSKQRQNITLSNTILPDSICGRKRAKRCDRLYAEIVEAPTYLGYWRFIQQPICVIPYRDTLNIIGPSSGSGAGPSVASPSRRPSTPKNAVRFSGSDPWAVPAKITVNRVVPATRRKIISRTAQAGRAPVRQEKYWDLNRVKPMSSSSPSPRRLTPPAGGSSPLSKGRPPACPNPSNHTSPFHPWH
jgi:hypothetical protein